MDPYSAFGTAQQLAQTAFNTVNWVCDVVQGISNVDDTVGELVQEAKQFRTLLSSMEKTIGKCQSTVALTLPHIDDQTWVQMDLMFKDCNDSLQDLSKLFRRISKNNNLETSHPEPSSSYFAKSKKYIRFEWYSSDISIIRDKIQKSMRAVELMMKVIHVSLTLRSDERLDTISQDLTSLYTLMEQALAKANDNAFNEATATQGANLKQLANHARRFHSAASSTASTMYGGAGNRHSRASFVNWGGSEFGDLSDTRRQDIKNWNIQIIEEAVEDTVNTPATTLHGSQHSVFSESLPLKPMSTDGLSYSGVYLSQPSDHLDVSSSEPIDQVTKTSKVISWTLITFSIIFRLIELGLAATLTVILGQKLSTKQVVVGAQHISLLYSMIINGLSIATSLLGLVPLVLKTLRWPMDAFICICWIAMVALFATSTCYSDVCIEMAGNILFAVIGAATWLMSTITRYVFSEVNIT